MAIEAAVVLAQQSETVSGETVAIISGASAVLGSLVGGAVTGFFSLRGERARQAFARRTQAAADAREDDRERAIVRGTSREMCRSLRVSADFLDRWQEAGVWWPNEAPSELQEFGHLAERKAVAAAATAWQWEQVEEAEQAIRDAHLVRRIAITQALAQANNGEPASVHNVTGGAAVTPSLTDQHKTVLGSMAIKIRLTADSLKSLCVDAEAASPAHEDGPGKPSTSVVPTDQAGK
jgi:hypothetical protein